MKPVALLALVFAFNAAGAAAEGLTPEEVKRLALEAILENPEIVFEAAAIIRDREEAARAQTVRSTITELKDALEADPNAPVLGNPAGDVTVVEFFDYNCPYCMQAAGEVQTLIETDPNVRLVYREWPILGEGSVYAARAALAAREQDLYEEFHWALMEERARKDEAVVLRVAARVGLDIERLKADMEGETVRAHIAQSMALARALGFSGTPSFVIGEEGVNGLVSVGELRQYVAEARAPVAEGN